MTNSKKSKKKTVKKPAKKKKKKKRSKKKAKKKQAVTKGKTRNKTRNKNDKNISDKDWNAPQRVTNSDKFEEQEVITEETVRRQIWQTNHQRIESAFWTLTSINHKFPSQFEIAAEADLSRKTVQKHMQEFTPENLSQQFRPDLMIERVLVGLATAGAEGDAASGVGFINIMTKLGFIKEKKSDVGRPDWRDFEREVKQTKEITTESRMERIHKAILQDNADE